MYYIKSRINHAVRIGEWSYYHTGYNSQGMAELIASSSEFTLYETVIEWHETHPNKLQPSKRVLTGY